MGRRIFYAAGNILEGRVTAGQKWGGVKLPPNPDFMFDEPFFEPRVKTQTAAQAYEDVLANVGCNFPALDDHDRRVLAEVREGTARYRGSRTGLPGLPDSQEDVGGWEDYPEVHRPPGWDKDLDGMPDDWEKAHGLDPNDPADGNGDLNGDGYTNLEKYLNSLVGEYTIQPGKK